VDAVAGGALTAQLLNLLADAARARMSETGRQNLGAAKTQDTGG
jgi:hypothetical protein